MTDSPENSAERIAVKEGLATPEETKLMAYAKSPKEILTIRAIVIAALGSAILTASSLYVALRMGALPWPSIFAVIVSMSILKVFKGNLNEMNVSHTGMTAGALLAGGLAFTVPALWMLGYGEVPMNGILLGSLAAAIGGSLVTLILRDQMIVRLRLPYPIGIASFLTLKAGDVGGVKRNILIISILIACLIVALRDWFGLVPAIIMFAGLIAYNIYVGIGIYPMALGIGYIIGLLYMGTWFLGAVFSHLIVVPIATNILGYTLVEAQNFTRSLGIGLIIGGGLAIILSAFLKYLTMQKTSLSIGKEISLARTLPTRYILLFLVLLVALLIGGGLGPHIAVIAVLGMLVTSVMAAVVTGQTGIDPMEIFGILILLFTMWIFGGISIVEGILLVMFIACAVGIVGDCMNDLKAGYLLETPPRYQVISEVVGAIVGAIVGAFTLLMLVSVYGVGAFGPDKFFVAPQAYAVSIMLRGIPNILAFVIGLIAGVVLGLLKIPSMTIGIGVYLPMIITVPAALGAFIRLIVDRKYPKLREHGVIFGSGLLGGEGIAGVIISLIYFLLGR
ncbi:MAG: OPT/YSL family transporter [Metallosphaera sp.]